MITCVNCGESNREGYIYCDNCGKPLKTSVQERNQTRKLGKVSDGLKDAAHIWGTAHLTLKTEVLLHITNEDTPIKLQISKKNIVGREDVSTNSHPDIDLVPYGGLEKGVSRAHAAIQLNDNTLTIVDLGSSNGTFLNGQRLVSNQPRIIHDGDELRFGKLQARIYFR